MEELVWIAFLVIGIFAIPIILAIVAMNKAERVSRELFKLRNEVDLLRSSGLQPAAPDTLPEAETAPPPGEPEAEPSPEEDFAATTTMAAGNANESEPVTAEPAAQAARSSLEENLAGTWFIWIGAVAIGLAGLFLVKYMSDAGLLGPGIRIILGLVCGTGLAVAGEWLRRKPSQRRFAALKPDYVPQALTAGGLAAVFASVYAANALYGFIGPTVTFAALAATALAAFALSVVQGPLVAIVGLLGGFVLPVLIGSADPFAPGLFSYLGLLFAAVCAVMTWRSALWLAVSATVLASGWVMLWANSFFATGDGLTLGLFSALIGTGFAFAGSVASRDDQPAIWHPPMWPKDILQVAAAIAGTVAMLLLLVLLMRDGYGNGSLIALGLFAVAACVAAIRAQRFDFLTLIAGLGVLLGFAEWGGRLHVEGWVDGWLVPGQSAWGPDPSAETSAYLKYSAMFGAAALAAGYVLLWRSVRPWLWATLGSVVPIGLMVAAYATLRSLEPSQKWAFAALGLAAVFVFLGSRLRSVAADEPPRLALGIYAMAACASIAMALSFVLRDAWLSASLAALLAATGYISRSLDLPQLRWPAILIALAVLARLGLNLHVLDYADSHWLGRYWVVYGYGLPLVMFHMAWLQFGRDETRDLLSKVLEGGRIALVAMFVSALIRVVVAGSLGSERFNLLEAGLHITSWLVSAAACWRRWSVHGGFIDLWAGRILTALACAVLIAWPLLGLNPVFFPEMVGNWPLVNALTPAYLLPGVLLAFIGYILRNHSTLPLWRTVWPPACLGLVLVWLSMEIRRFFHAPNDLDATFMSTPENYTYSAVWLLFALALLAAGITARVAQLRYAALAVLVLVVLKVFLVDLSDLEGLLRVASFLGLGLCLVGIGFIYQRFVHRPADQPAT
ncbi:MAG: DUF2339 domain-containing protein [Pseudomonadota bacterium]